MIKFEVQKRFSTEIAFTAEIDCEEKMPRSWKLRLAVLWAIQSEADLSKADLSWADLSKADLSWANLSRANLSKANLSKANLSRANLSKADLSKANLSKANLSWADLSEANLSWANLWATIGNMQEVKSFQIDTYAVTYTSETLQIGCKRYPIEDWWKFSQKEIHDMNGDKAVTWWERWKPIIQAFIKEMPAEPTGYVVALETEGAK